MPNIMLCSMLRNTVGLPESTRESKRTARRLFLSPDLRRLRDSTLRTASRHGPLKQSTWPESNWTLPSQTVGVTSPLGWFHVGFGRPSAKDISSWPFVFSDSDGKDGVVDYFTVHPGLEALWNRSVLLAVQVVDVMWRFVARLLPGTQTIPLIQIELL